MLELCLCDWELQSSELEFGVSVPYQFLKDPILSPKPDTIGWFFCLSWGCQDIIISLDRVLG